MFPAIPRAYNYSQRFKPNNQFFISENLSKPSVESIPKYQSILEHLEQNITEGGRDWIGTIEASYVLDMIFQVSLLTEFHTIILVFSSYHQKMPKNEKRD